MAQAAEFERFMSAFNKHAARHGLVTGLGNPLQFVPQDKLPSGYAYESFIAQTGGVPTRSNFHDRYNALMWLAAPRTKALLNRLQHEEIERLEGVTRRGPVRDALTLWDENLAVVVTRNNSDMLTDLLKAHDWRTLFLEHRLKWNTEWQLRLFGHALMEKLHAPYKAITAHVLVIESDSSDWPVIDATLCAWLSAQAQRSMLTTKVFSPLPVMGIPGWCGENEVPEFYADTSVFR